MKKAEQNPYIKSLRAARHCRVPARAAGPRVVGLALAALVGLASCLPRGHLLPGDPTAGGPGDLDPRDYDSFEEFFRDAPAPLSREYLRERWDRVHAGDVQHPVVPDPEDLPEPMPEGVDLGETPLVEYEGSEQIRFSLGLSGHNATGRTIPDQRFDGPPSAFERALKRYYGGDPIAAFVEHGFTVGYFIPHRGGAQFGGNMVSRDGALLWAVAPMREWRVGGDYFALIPLPVPPGKVAKPIGWAVRGGARVVVYGGRIAAHAVTVVGKRARHIAHAAPAVRAAYRTARAVIHGASGRGARAAGTAGRSGAGHAAGAAGRSGAGHAAGAAGAGSARGAAGSTATGRASGASASTASAASELRWTVHGGKHVASSKIPWNKIVASTKRGPAKYRPGTKIEALERRVWAEGRATTNGRTWKVMEFADDIGASGGKTSRWVRVEASAGTIHGHPITHAEYLKLIR